ncbi:MAG TPA: outer membrane protein assembly factor BamC [Gallionella sp.]|nr:outer membrane protein assembly factor BamC [Gallionella sp.]
MKVWQIGISCVVLVLLVGCKSLGLGSKRIDYGTEAGQVPALEVPPDLTAPASDERYRVPQGDGEGVATYSDYSKGNAATQDRSAREVVPSEAKAAVSTVAVASTAVTVNASGPAGTASLEEIFDGSKIIVVNDAFDRSWRRVGLAIERAGLAVEDKDRVKGIYFLRPAKAEKGWLDKLQFWTGSEDSNTRYRVSVKDGGAACEVSVTDQDGASDDATKQMIEAIYKNINQ